ncbi:MAG: helix-turn-helix domain-containing protein [Spirochaetaceae bacterium]|nr:helix-turn-helix domain-containing protein [Myxococcales bacterium]MCB9725379.1 helix-turn-helix domain-containing protein [Spirochaetaceae bacterium]
MADSPLTETQAAERVGIKPGTLAHWRSAGTGPPYVKVGGRVRYLTRDLDDWLDSRRVEPAAERGAA